MSNESSARPRALVTGASAGIGRCIAQRLLTEGFDVAVLARRKERLLELAPLAEKEGASLLVLPADLAQRESVDSALKLLVAQWPTLNALVLNAGANAKTPLDSPRTDDFDRLMEVNLTSVHRTLRTLAPHLVDGGSVVAIGSILGRFGIPVYHGYCASKAGLMGLVRAVALELASRGITVNAVLPGWTDTDMARGAIAAQAPGMGMDAEQARKVFESQIPLRRMVEPSEVAGLVSFLLGKDARAMTGQALNLDGGVMV